MHEVLEILYDCLHSNMSSSEERAILKRDEAFLDEMERRLGQEDFSRFWDIVSELGRRRAESDFRLGFWLGANLILAAKEASFPQN